MTGLPIESEPNPDPYWGDIRDGEGVVKLELLAERLGGLPSDERTGYFLSQLGLDKDSVSISRIIPLEHALRQSSMSDEGEGPCSYYDIYASLVVVCPFYERTDAGRELLDALPTHKVRYAGYLEYALRTRDERDTERALSEAVLIDKPQDIRPFDFRMMRGDLPSHTSQSALEYVYAVAKALGHSSSERKAAELLGPDTDFDALDKRAERFAELRSKEVRSDH